MEIVVPTSWDDITVNQYQALSQINKDDYTNDLAYTTSVMQVLCNLDNMQSLPISAISELAPHIQFMSTEIPKDRIDTVELDGVTYKWLNSFNEMTVGEAISIELPIDLEELTYALSYDVVLAVMLREDGKKFNAKEFKNNRDKFGSLPITQVIGQLLFFLNGGQTSIAHTKTYSIVPMRSTTSRMKNLNRWQRMTRKLTHLISG